MVSKSIYKRGRHSWLFLEKQQIERVSEWEINIIIMIKIKMFRVIIRFKSFRIWLRKNDLFFDCLYKIQRSLCLMKLSIKKCYKIRYTTMHEHKFYSFAENHLTHLFFFSVMDIKKKSCCVNFSNDYGHSYFIK